MPILRALIGAAIFLTILLGLCAFTLGFWLMENWPLLAYELTPGSVCREL